MSVVNVHSENWCKLAMLDCVFCDSESECDMSKDIKVRKRKLSDYKQDQANANKGNKRGQQMIDQSVTELGAGRSGLVSRDDVFIAGNHASQAMQAAGIEEVIEIEAEPGQWVVVKRNDIQSGTTEARRMAIADNRANEANLEWELDHLLADPAALDGFFRDDELEDLLADAEVEKAVNDDLAEGQGESSKRALGDRKQQIKPVLYVDEVAIFEQAIKATGMINRGQAVLEICKQYLASKEAGHDAEG